MRGRRGGRLGLGPVAFRAWSNPTLGRFWATSVPNKPTHQAASLDEEPWPSAPLWGLLDKENLVGGTPPKGEPSAREQMIFIKALWAPPLLWEGAAPCLKVFNTPPRVTFWQVLTFLGFSNVYISVTDRVIEKL